MLELAGTFSPATSAAAFQDRPPAFKRQPLELIATIEEADGELERDEDTPLAACHRGRSMNAISLPSCAEES